MTQAGTAFAPARAERPWYYVLFALVVATSAVATASTLHAEHSWGFDFAAYIAQAQSIVESTLPKLIQLSEYRQQESTHDVMIGPTLYPWGFPILLSPIYALSGGALLPMKVLVLGFYVLSLVLAFAIARQRMGALVAVVVVFPLAISPALSDSANNTLSDFPALLFSLLSLYLMDRMLVRRRPLVGVWFDHLLLGTFVFFAFVFRTQAGSCRQSCFLRGWRAMWAGKTVRSPAITE